MLCGMALWLNCCLAALSFQDDGDEAKILSPNPDTAAPTRLPDYRVHNGGHSDKPMGSL